MMMRGTCRDSIDLLDGYVDGTLPPEDRAKLDGHFEDCPPCRAFLDAYRATPKLARTATEFDMPDEVRERLKRFLEKEK